MAKDTKEDSKEHKTKTAKPKSGKAKTKSASAAKASDKKKAASPAKAPKAGEERQAASPSPKPPKVKKSPARARGPLIDKTFFAKKQTTVDSWQIIDAAGQPLGRLSTYIANALMGKDKPTYTRHSDTGDHVIVVNAKDVVLTGNKMAAKEYHHHTGYAGGIKTFTAEELRKKTPERLIEKAVYGMLPKGHMGRRWYGKLRVFAGADHPHSAQQPRVVNLPSLSTRRA